MRRELPLFWLFVTVLNIFYWSSNVGCSTIPVTFFSSIFKCRVKWTKQCPNVLERSRTAEIETEPSFENAEHSPPVLILREPGVVGVYSCMFNCKKYSCAFHLVRFPWRSQIRCTFLPEESSGGRSASYFREQWLLIAANNSKYFLRGEEKIVMIINYSQP